MDTIKPISSFKLINVVADPRRLLLLDLLQTAGFRRQLEDLGGYSTAQTGNVILVD